MSTPRDPNRSDGNDERTDPMLAALRALRESSPPPSLVPAVMRRVAEPERQSFWAWLRRPRRFELRLSPLGLSALTGVAVCLLVAASVARKPVGPEGGAPAVAEAPSDVVHVRFVLQAKGAKQVSLAGDFNGWRAETTALENSDGQGTFVVTVPLRRGAHEYMFLVDGQWVTDPAASELRPDGFGRRNGVLRL